MREPSRKLLVISITVAVLTGLTVIAMALIQGVPPRIRAMAEYQNSVTTARLRTFDCNC